MMAQRMMRPVMPNNNPGLRHLLQQQVNIYINASPTVLFDVNIIFDIIATDSKSISTNGNAKCEYAKPWNAERWHAKHAKPEYAKSRKPEYGHAKSG